MPTDTWPRLMLVPPWQDHQLLNARTLLEHEAQYTALASNFGQANWGQGNFGLLTSTGLEWSPGDAGVIHWQLKEAVGITTTGRLLVLADAQGTIPANSPDSYLLLGAYPVLDSPHLLWHHGHTLVADQDATITMVTQGMALPLGRVINGTLDQHYLPPAMRLGAYPQLWQAASAIATQVAKCMDMDTTVRGLFTPAWYPSWALSTLAMQAPQAWILEQARIFASLAYANMLTPETRTKLHHLVQGLTVQQLDLRPVIDSIGAAWVTIDTALSSPPPELPIARDATPIPQADNTPSLRDNQGFTYHPINTMVQSATDGGGKPCFWIQISEGTQGRPLLLALTKDQPQNPGEWRLVFSTPNNSRWGISNVMLNFTSRPDEANVGKFYWVADILTGENLLSPKNHKNITILVPRNNTLGPPLLFAKAT